MSRSTLASFASAITAVLVLALAPSETFAQKAFRSAEDAAKAFVHAVAISDNQGLRDVLGADFRRYIPVGSVNRQDVYAFLNDWAQGHKIVMEGDRKAELAVGENGWTLPIPIVKGANGWHFDTRAGAEEMRIRRIGRNELAAMQAVLAYYDAQKEYAEQDRDGNQLLEYAQKMVSTPGRQDGLYWTADGNSGESPLGRRFADARRGEPYHGYLYKILTAQGKDAPGGAYDYVNKGHMTGGFALVAWPAKYGNTGIMTFIVNHDGVVYEKDLGPHTDAIAPGMKRFNPDSSWTKAEPVG